MYESIRRRPGWVYDVPVRLTDELTPLEVELLAQAWRDLDRTSSTQPRISITGKQEVIFLETTPEAVKRHFAPRLDRALRALPAAAEQDEGL